MIKLLINMISKILVLLLLLKNIALANNFLLDENDKLFIKTSNSGFTSHKNFMSQNDYNFKYIRDNSKARAGDYLQKFELTELVSRLKFVKMSEEVASKKEKNSEKTVRK